MLSWIRKQLGRKEDKQTIVDEITAGNPYSDAFEEAKKTTIFDAKYNAKITEELNATLIREFDSFYTALEKLQLTEAIKSMLGVTIGNSNDWVLKTEWLIQEKGAESLRFIFELRKMGDNPWTANLLLRRTWGDITRTSARDYGIDNKTYFDGFLAVLSDDKLDFCSMNVCRAKTELVSKIKNLFSSQIKKLGMQSTVT